MNALVYGELSKDVFEYSVIIPNDNYSTNIAVKVSENNTVVISDGDVTLNYNKPHYISIMDYDGNLVIYKLNVLEKSSILLDVNIEGYDFNFNPVNFEYDLSINDVIDLNFEIIASDDTTYTINQNE